jgi:outer membrane receptor protein involved in Fe transport
MRFNVAPAPIQWLWVGRRDRRAGLFAQQEWALGRRWQANLGARFDWSWLKRSAISPRIAVTYKPANGTDLKLMYGRGFRNPSSYDMYWADGFTQIGNSSLRPETSDTYEFDIDQAFSRRLRASASVYHYRVNGFIEQVFTAGGLTQYVNGDRVRATGASLELDWVLPRAVRLSSSLEMQRATFSSTHVLPNSPGQVAKLRFAIPLWRERLIITTGIQALGQRQTYAGATVPWVMLPEAVVSAAHLAGGFEFSAGVRNLSNSFYRDPAGLTPTVDSVIGMGRSYFLNLTWHSSADKVARSD